MPPETLGPEERETREGELSLPELVDRVRAVSGVEGETMLEEWDRRRQSGELITEKELQSRIDEIEANIDTLKYGSALERSMYYAVQERVRLHAQRTHGYIDPRDPDIKRDTELLKQLGTRIAYAMHEEAKADEIFDAVTQTAQYREKYELNRSASEGGIPRDAKAEGKIRKQLLDLKALFPHMATVRKIRFYQFLLSNQPGRTDVKPTIENLEQALPQKVRGMPMEKAYGILEQDLRTILGESVPSPVKGATVPIAFAGQRRMIDAHFDSILTRREKLIGKTDNVSEKSKKDLLQEHERMFDDVVTLHIDSFRRMNLFTGNLAREGQFDQPVDDATEKQPDRDFGLLSKPEVLKEELQKYIIAQRLYIKNFRESVLRENKSTRIPLVGDIPFDVDRLIEDIMTTHIIPQKVRLAEPIAQGSTVLWGVHDSAWGLVNLDFDIREKRTQMILQPIYTRLGLPENYAELSPDEQTAARKSPIVQEKLMSVDNIIDDFYATREKILTEAENDTIRLEELLKKRDSTVELKGPPTNYESMPALGEIQTQEDITGAIIFLLDRMEHQRPSELNIAYKNFIQELNKNLTLNIDVADIEVQLANAIWRESFYATSAMLGEGAAIYLTVRKGVPFAIRKTPAALRMGARMVRGTGRMAVEGAKVTGRTAQRLTQLSRNIGSRPAPGGADRAIEGARRARFVGPLVTVAGTSAAALDARRILDQTLRLEPLPELDTIEAALEFWQMVPDKEADLYPVELEIIGDRLNALIMQRTSLTYLHELEKRYPEHGKRAVPPAVQSLKDRLTALEKHARRHKERLRQSFPIDAVLRTDPKRESGNVAVLKNYLDEARLKGLKFRQQSSNILKLSSVDKPQPEVLPQGWDSFDYLKQQYEQLMQDAEREIEK